MPSSALAEQRKSDVKTVIMESVLDAVCKSEVQKAKLVQGFPRSLCFDRLGNLYIGCQSEERLKVVSFLKQTIADVPCKDHQGLTPQFFCSGITISKTSVVYFADCQNYTVKSLSPKTNLVKTIYIAPKDNSSTESLITDPWGIVIDNSEEHLYVTDYSVHNIKKLVISDGTVSTFCGSPLGNSGKSDGIGTEARFWYPFAIAKNRVGDKLFVSDLSNCSLRSIDVNSKLVKTLLNREVLEYPRGLICDGNDDLLICNNGLRAVVKFNMKTNINPQNMK